MPNFRGGNSGDNCYTNPFNSFNCICVQQIHQKSIKSNCLLNNFECEEQKSGITVLLGPRVDQNSYKKMHMKLREIHIKFQLSIIREVGDISIVS